MKSVRYACSLVDFVFFCPVKFVQDVYNVASYNITAITRLYAVATKVVTSHMIREISSNLVTK